ncbi:MAG: DUF1194 domain-containing protein [Pseudomonadota bacterium]
MISWFKPKLAALSAAILFLALGVIQPAAQDGQLVDLELILAVDTSSSVSSQEFDLQMQGLAEAFRHPSVQAAIEAAGDLGIAVAMVQWSDNRKQTVAIPWQVLRGAASAEAFAAEISRTPRFLVGGGTALGGALDFSLRQFGRNAFNGRRKVIDISGDGRTNQGAHPSRFRDEAVALGITINGLAILNEDVYVDRYYRYNVIGGTGAFVMTAQDYEDFSVAILEKLIKEIAGAPVASLPAPEPPNLAARSDLQSDP